MLTFVGWELWHLSTLHDVFAHDAVSYLDVVSDHHRGLLLATWLSNSIRDLDIVKFKHWDKITLGGFAVKVCHSVGRRGVPGGIGIG